MAKHFNRFPYTFAFGILGAFWVLFSKSPYPPPIDIACKVLGVIAVGVGVGGRLYSTLFIGGMKNEGIDGKTFIDYGPYANTRNPLYFFSFIAFMGLLALQAQIILLVVGALGFYWIYQRTIKREESFLVDKFGDSYRQYLKSVPRFFRAGILKRPSRFSCAPNFCTKKSNAVLCGFFSCFSCCCGRHCKRLVFSQFSFSRHNRASFVLAKRAVRAPKDSANSRAHESAKFSLCGQMRLLRHARANCNCLPLPFHTPLHS